jgi:hypothetical protein
MEDPDTQLIVDTCQSIVGAKISLSYSIVFADGSSNTSKFSNCNIVGDVMESVIYPHLKKSVPTLEEGPKQDSPDYWNRDRTFELEQKTFMGTPGFDIGSITGYISSLARPGGVNRKLYKTKYIIFEYILKNDEAEVKQFWSLSVWDLCGAYGGKKPINIGGGKGVNIRPATKNQWTSPEGTNLRTPTKFLDMIEALIGSIWYKEPEIDKQHNLRSIQEQRAKLNI